MYNILSAPCQQAKKWKVAGIHKYQSSQRQMMKPIVPKNPLERKPGEGLEQIRLNPGDDQSNIGLDPHQFNIEFFNLCCPSSDNEVFLIASQNTLL